LEGRFVTTVKQICLGFAVAGAVIGGGSTVATAVAYAAPTSADAHGSTSVGASDSSNAAGPPSLKRSPGQAPKTKASARAAAPKTAAKLTSARTAKAAPNIRVITPVRPAPAHLPLPLPAPVLPAASTRSTGVGAANAAALLSRSASTGPTVSVYGDPTAKHVLLIGVDGTNLSKILANTDNVNFYQLMTDGTTAASSIVGHTTISNPSWTAILTGVWDTKSGVINNIFTPGTYDKWPTVFNQLEAFNPDIDTTAIADWDIITDIAGAGSIPADSIVFVPQVAGDTNWSKTDKAVTDETVSSILAADPDAPTFIYSYLVQVDENGHQFGGASQQYADAVTRTDANIGLIMQAVADSGEDWTVIVVTDHGHQPQKGFGHGFQSPAETSTFVIADGPDFAPGQINSKYSIVDVTPTVVTLFGGTPTSDADGVPLMTLGQSQVTPANLRQALQDAIAMYGYPDIVTNVALSLRTIFATIPYYVDLGTNAITAQLQGVVDQQIFLVSTLAAVAKVGVQIGGDVLYAATNAVAQVVARLTGAGVIPPSTSTVQQATLPESVLV
jgi:hypothetical protein